MENPLRHVLGTAKFVFGTNTDLTIPLAELPEDAKERGEKVVFMSLIIVIRRMLRGGIT
jgi:hypothetical protein